LENDLEESIVEASKKDDENKLIKRKFGEFQKMHLNCEKEKKDL